MNDDAEIIITHLSNALAKRMKALGTEERFPGSDADESDNKIKRLRVEIDELRQKRNELEELFYG